MFCKIKRNLMKNVETSYTCAVSVIGLQEKTSCFAEFNFSFGSSSQSAKSSARSSEEEEKQWKKSTIIPFLEYLPSTDRPMKDPPRTTYKVCCTTQCMSPCVLYVCVCLDYYGPCVVSIFSIFSHFRLLFSANFSTKIVQSPSNSSSCVFPPTLKKISGR